MFHLSRNSKILRVANAAAAGTTDVNSDSVDMAAYRSATFVAAVGALTATQVTKLKLQQSQDDGVVDDWTDIQGSATAALADTDGNKLLVIHLMRPTKRYVRAVLDRGTANAVLDGIIAILGYPDPSSTSGAHATVAVSKILRTPGEGVA